MKRWGKRLLQALAILFLVAGLGGMKAEAAPRTMPDGTVFDPEYYASTNPDVVAVLGTDPNMLYLHYTLYGRAEGRLAVAPSADGFDAAYYAARYPDVAAALGRDPQLLFLHYSRYGKAEGRFGSAAEEQAAINAAAQLAAQRAAEEAAAQAAAQQAQDDYAHRVLALVNQERANNGLAPLEWSTAMEDAVAVRAQEIATSFSHTRPNGSSCFTAIPSGVPYPHGENIAAGQRTPEEVMDSWMHSSGHRANILGNYGHLAVGYIKTNSGYGHYWVQLFSG